MHFPRYTLNRVKSVVTQDTGYKGPNLWPPLEGRPVGPVRKQHYRKRRKPYSRSELFEINQAHYWESKWQTMQDDMAKALIENRKKANERMIGIHSLLRQTVVTWPETLTTKEIRTLVMGLVNQPHDATPRTMLRRITRLKMVEFNVHTRLWLNLCRLPLP